MLNMSEAAKKALCMIRETSGDGVDGRKVKNLSAWRQRDCSHILRLLSGSLTPDVSSAAVYRRDMAASSVSYATRERYPPIWRSSVFHTETFRSLMITTIRQ
jgi:hypothetical protein